MSEVLLLPRPADKSLSHPLAGAAAAEKLGKRRGGEAVYWIAASKASTAWLSRMSQALRRQRCLVNWPHADHSEPQDPKPVVSREEVAPVFTLVVAERLDLGRHLIV
jgi:hypothetical protein